jgi:type IV pilus assembly protein PilB
MSKRLKLGEMLVSKGLITEPQLASALGEQRRWGKRLGMTLVLMGFLEEETLIRTLASQLKLPVARIRGKRVNPEVVELVPVELAEKHRCLPLFVKEQGGSRELFLAMEDPSDLDAQGELGFRIGFRIRPVLVAPTELEDALQRHYHWAAVVGGTGALPLASPAKQSAPEKEEPFEDTAPELAAALAAANAPAPSPETPEDTQPDPPDIERAAAELGSFGDDAAAAKTRPSERERDAESASRAISAAISQDVILRALTQLLVEKGVLTRDELVERLRTLAAKTSESRDGQP